MLQGRVNRLRLLMISGNDNTRTDDQRFQRFGIVAVTKMARSASATKMMAIGNSACNLLACPL